MHLFKCISKEEIEVNFKALYYLCYKFKRKLTHLGYQMLELPIDPQISRLLIKYGKELPCVFYLGAALHLAKSLREFL